MFFSVLFQHFHHPSCLTSLALIPEPHTVAHRQALAALQVFCRSYAPCDPKISWSIERLPAMQYRATYGSMKRAEGRWLGGVSCVVRVDCDHVRHCEVITESAFKKESAGVK